VVVSEHEQDVGLGARVAPELCGGRALVQMYRRAFAAAEHREADVVGLAPLIGDANLVMVVAGQG